MFEWKLIVLQNAENVFRIAFRILGSEHDAEDVTQDVFFEAFGLAEPQEVRDWTGLLRRMATFRSIDCLRRRRPTSALDVNLPVDADPSSEVVAREMSERLREAISKLSRQQAVVFSLAYLESVSRDEIAESLGVSPTSVSTALYKARKKLKSLFFETTQEITNG